MRLILFILFVVVPILEIATFIQMGSLIGLGWTLASILLTAVIGASLPVFFGMLLEGAPSSLQITGFLFAFAAIWLLSASHKSREIQWLSLIHI